MKLRIEFIVVLAVALVALGYFLGVDRGGKDEPPADAAQLESEMWTCSMHPQIQLPEEGQCPICFMDLIPVGGHEGQHDSERTLSMSESAMRLAEIQTRPVERRFPSMELRMVGKIEFDESRMREISAWVPGRLDRLYVDYTGISIQKGDHLVSMYSPDLISAQEELLQAIRAQKDLEQSGVDLLRETTRETIAAAREKLRLLGLTPRQIENLESRQVVEDHVTIYAPFDGIVIAKHAVEGKYVATGESIYSIADVSQLWVKLDAYESDLAWLRYGQELSFTTEAYPGRVYSGKISFIDPVLDPTTRTAKVRVNVENADLTLKPEMFVRAEVDVLVAATGRVMSEDLAGKFVCPMHPEIVSDHADDCDICGMDLVRAETLGYETPDSQTAPLIVPATAPLVTGRRAVVYVQLPGTERPTFEGREVVLGSRAGDFYVVESGLEEGERVVVNGAFKIDSAMQIQAKPSMMAPDGGGGGSQHQHGETPRQHSSTAEPLGDETLRAGLSELLLAAMGLSDALAADDFTAAGESMKTVSARLKAVDASGLDGSGNEAWEHSHGAIHSAAQAATEAGSLDDLRGTLPALTSSLARAARDFGVGEQLNLVRAHCPMAFDGEGADWLQKSGDIANPYYGASMLRCGNTVEQFGNEGDGHE